MSRGSWGSLLGFGWGLCLLASCEHRYPGPGDASAAGVSAAAGADSGDGGTAGVPSIEEPACAFGEACTCDGGLSGTTTCDPAQPCACKTPVCTPPNPIKKPPAFAYCGGGVPTGDWGSVEVDSSALKGVFIDPDDTRSVCQALDIVPAQTTMLLRLNTDGTGAIADSGIGYSANFVQECAAPSGDPCTVFPGCVAGACGSCACSRQPKPFNDDAIKWSYKDNVLTLVLGDGTLSFEYCVENGTLTLLATDGSDLVLKLQHGYLHGKPQACSERTAAKCEGDGCYVSSCMGDQPYCSGVKDKANCDGLAGCSWGSAPQCAGPPPPSSCAFAEYGVRPGCSFTAGNALCSGTPLACEGRDSAHCAITLGCVWQGSCLGTPLNCDKQPLERCEALGGCELVPN